MIADMLSHIRYGVHPNLKINAGIMTMPIVASLPAFIPALPDAVNGITGVILLL